MNKEILKRLSYTFIILFVFLLGGVLPLPFVESDTTKLNVLQNMLLFTAGQTKLSWFMLGVAPFATASILLSLLGFMSKRVKRWQESGASGKMKLTKALYGLTFVLGVIQASILINVFGIIGNYIDAILMIMLVACGGVFVGYLAGRINVHGIGQGLSLMVVSGVVTRVPSIWEGIHQKGLAWNIYDTFWIQVLVWFVILVYGFGVYWLLQCKTPLVIHSGQYGVSDVKHTIDIKALASGVLPVIVVSSLFGVIGQVGSMLGLQVSWVDLMRYRGVVVYTVCIMLATYVYNLIQLDSARLSEQLAVHNCYVEGVSHDRLGLYIDRQIVRASHIGVIGIGLIVIVPLLVAKWLGLGVLGGILGSGMILILSAMSEVYHHLDGLKVIGGKR